MRRRALLRSAALATAAGIAGCTTDETTDDGAGGDGGGASPTDSPTDALTDSPTHSPTDVHTDTRSDTPADEHTGSDGTDERTATRTRTPQGNGIVAEEFEVTGQGCGTGENAVDIAFDGQEVTLDGVIDGTNGCYTAEQESVAYDPATDRLRVDVRSYQPNEDRMCTDCIVDIEYEARYVFEGETPDEVTVAHDGRAVASASRESASATPSE